MRLSFDDRSWTMRSLLVTLCLALAVVVPGGTAVQAGATEDRGPRGDRAETRAEESTPPTRPAPIRGRGTEVDPSDETVEENGGEEDGDPAPTDPPTRPRVSSPSEGPRVEAVEPSVTGAVRAERELPPADPDTADSCYGDAATIEEIAGGFRITLPEPGLACFIVVPVPGESAPFAALNALGASLAFSDGGTCGLGSPRFLLITGQGIGIYAYLGTPPSFTCGASQAGFDLLADGAARFEIIGNPTGGPLYKTYDELVAALASLPDVTLSSVALIVDSVAGTVDVTDITVDIDDSALPPPSISPSDAPSLEPLVAPSLEPSAAPSEPSAEPSAQPTLAPSEAPSGTPGETPSPVPSVLPDPDPFQLDVNVAFCLLPEADGVVAFDPGSIPAECRGAQDGELTVSLYDGSTANADIGATSLGAAAFGDRIATATTDASGTASFFFPFTFELPDTVFVALGAADPYDGAPSSQPIPVTAGESVAVDAVLLVDDLTPPGQTPSNPPSEEPTSEPTTAPTAAPTVAPSDAPSPAPTAEPSESSAPSAKPSKAPGDGDDGDDDMDDEDEVSTLPDTGAGTNPVIGTNLAVMIFVALAAMVLVAAGVAGVRRSGTR